MPIVPKATRQVQLQALPDARLTAAETPESEGAGIAEAHGEEAAALTGVGAGVAKIGEDMFAKETEKANAVVNIKNNADLTGWVDKRLNDPDTGALQTRGNNALGLPEKVMDEYNTYADTVAAGLSNDKQKRAFDQIRAERGLTLQNKLMEHTASQINQVKADTADSAVRNSQSFAISNADDPRIVGQELKTQVDTVTAIGKQLGMSDESIKARIDATVSATHVGIVQQLLAQNKTQKAKVYFEEAKDQINGADQPRLEDALKHGDAQAEGIKRADAIIAEGGTLTQQLAKARAITADNPDDDRLAKVREQTEQYLEHNDARNDKAKRDDQEAATTAGLNILDRYNGDLSKIPPTTMVSATAAMRSAWRTYADYKQRGEDVPNDWATFYKLADTAGRDPNAFANTNLMLYRGKLSDAKFSQLTDWQLSIRNKEEKPPPAAEHMRTNEQIVEDSIHQWNPTFPNPAKRSADQDTAVANLRNLLDDFVEKNTKPGTKMLNSDIQAEADRILSTRANVPPSQLRTILSSIMPSMIAPLPAQGKTVNELPVEQMRKFESERSQILAVQRAKGRPTDEATLLSIFMDAQKQ